MVAPVPPSLGTSSLGTSLGPAIGGAQSAASAASSVLSSAIPASIPSGADIGDFLKEQRQHAKLSLRRLAQEAGVSNPYLSQIERGLRRPSAEILQQLAKALRISAEQLYVQAGLLEDRGTSQAVEAALVSDVAITERQKRVLLDIYASFLAENEALASAAAMAEPTQVASPPAKKAAKKTTKRTAKKTTRGIAEKATKKAAKTTKTSAGATAKRTTRKSPAKKTTRPAAPRSAS